MKKIKLFIAVFLILTGVGGMLNKDYFAALIFIAIGVCLFVFPRNKQRTGSPAADVIPGGLGMRSEISDDYTRVHCDEWVVFDVETTGLSPYEDRIIEVAAVKYKNGEKVDAFVSLVNPGVPLSARITDLTGITDKDLKKAPRFSKIGQQLADFIGDLPLVAHNAKFDVDFLIVECARAGVKIDVRYIDTVRMAKWCLPPQPDYKLASLIETFGLLDHAQEHRALSDVEACENLYMRCRTRKSRSV